MSKPNKKKVVKKTKKKLKESKSPLMLKIENTENLRTFDSDVWEWMNE